MVHNLAIAVAGGILIGIAAGLFMLVNGRIMGASSLVAGLVTPASATWRENLLIVIGLPVGALAVHGGRRIGDATPDRLARGAGRRGAAGGLRHAPLRRLHQRPWRVR